MLSRRSFLRSSMAGAFPLLLPCGVLGENAPSKKIQIGVIGCGRIANGFDIPGIARNQDLATIVSVCDCDRLRAEAIREKVKNDFGTSPTLYGNYREMLANPAVDAVMICTPDFSHAEIAVNAALAGKDVYVQKPLAMTVFESRMIVRVFEKTGRIFHIGSQQRSEGKSTFGSQFRRAAEYVRDGRIGAVKTVEIGLPRDPKEPSDWPLSQPVPATFNWDAWQGRTPVAEYCELRSHPQGKDGKPNLNGRPGWMTVQCYDMGMIANWGAHHIDIAQWALNQESSGPIHIEGKAEYPKRRLWDVHDQLDVTMTYANGTRLHITNDTVYPNGVRFIGEKGWIFCSRSSQKATIDDRGAGGKHGRWRPLEASAQSLIEGEVAHPVVRNPHDHHRVWLESIRSRKPTNIPPETAHRTTTACILAYTAMKLARPLNWDPQAERYVNDEEANRTLELPERAPYGVRNALISAGFPIRAC